ncbi:DUF1361 domain-containing protein [Oceanihabitans sp. 2_MG-2023]|uniref:DUF1361 domain-containing protein n=1 Tax=Oceanihabitans sp. 2_MG-2023 TaxID=3062661 RepID=UPI0026E19102|nr:DUF1361 domain-containing protein [Oceanihabitans sp. 2_MG-2023]MDO6598268.1 DUF1361 domain-containing protein [Oceanihabitans sp. 2_MG-2023]
MHNLKSHIFNQYKVISLLSASMLLSIFLLMVRIKITHTYFFIFLVWNLFLAVIPYAITIYLKSREKTNKFQLAIAFSIWLLFLPNAPYIITDLIHLKISENPFFWLDVLLVTSFAYNGLMLFFLSMVDIKKLLQNYFSKNKVSYLMHAILLLTAFGIYLGRFLRYNSWDILQHPSILFKDILHMVIQPNQHLEVWLFTFTFGCFLAISFRMFQVFQKTGNS